MKLLEVRDLSIRYRSRQGWEEAVRGVSLEVERGEVVTLVGESGSGKSSVAMALGRITDFMPCEVQGSILFKERSILDLGPREIQRVRRTEIGYVFQEPAASLNPVLRVGDQIEEVLEHKTRAKIQELLSSVQLLDSERVSLAYPHELSGGMKQRVMIAMALAKNPDLVIADEPTTALDVTVQGEILKLFLQLQRKKQLSILFITHDLHIASMISNRIYIMQGGQIVEEIRDPKTMAVTHPYSRKLLSATRVGEKPKTYLEV